VKTAQEQAHATLIPRSQSMYRDPNLDLVAADMRRQDKLVADSLDWFREVALQAAEKLGPRPSRICLVGCGDSVGAHTAWASHGRSLWAFRLKLLRSSPSLAT
jgi:hypothetical protein